MAIFAYWINIIKNLMDWHFPLPNDSLNVLYQYVFRVLTHCSVGLLKYFYIFHTYNFKFKQR